MQFVDTDLRPEEFTLLATIDRAEHIDGYYVVEDATLRLIADDVHVAGWCASELDEYVDRLNVLHDAGGIVVGTWHNTTLVGLASLDVRPVSENPLVMKLDMLYVSAAYRHRRIGRNLVELLAERARTDGAIALYISATPTRNTVDAYVHLGAVVADPPDRHLLELEPNDVHLVLAL